MTGIVVSDDERLILRPFPLMARRRELLRGLAILIFVAIAAASLFALLFQAHVSIPTLVTVSFLAVCAMAYRVSTKVTFIALRDADGIYVETHNRILRWKRRKLLHRYADITGVETRSRVNPNAATPGAPPTGAYLHYDVILRKGTGEALFWYTRYPGSAKEIAERIAQFATVAVSARD